MTALSPWQRAVQWRFCPPTTPWAKQGSDAGGESPLPLRPPACMCDVILHWMAAYYPLEEEQRHGKNT